MKRICVILLCGTAVALVAGRKQDVVWEAPYTPTRLEWLALQCNINHRQRHEFAHSSFIAIPPNKMEVVIKLSKEAKAKDAAAREGLRQVSKEYVQGMAKAMGWVDPLEIEAIEIVQ